MMQSYADGVNVEHISSLIADSDKYTVPAKVTDQQAIVFAILITGFFNNVAHGTVLDLVWSDLAAKAFFGACHNHTDDYYDDLADAVNNDLNSDKGE
jgi:hypothetical protein